MKDFFMYHPRDLVYSFQTLEIVLPLVIMFLFLILIYTFKEQIRNYKQEHIIRYFIGSLFVLVELSITIYRIYYGVYGVDTLPLHLCSISIITSAVLMFTKNKKLHSVIFYWALIGGIVTLVMPVGLNIGSSHFRYYQFMTGHVLLVISSLYFVFVHRFIPAKKSILKSFIYLQIPALVSIIVNLSFDTHYMYTTLNSAPYIKGTPLELIPMTTLFTYVIGLELVALFAISALYLVARVSFKHLEYKDQLN